MEKLGRRKTMVQSLVVAGISLIANGIVDISGYSNHPVGFWFNLVIKIYLFSVCAEELYLILILLLDCLFDWKMWSYCCFLHGLCLQLRTLSNACENCRCWNVLNGWTPGSNRNTFCFNSGNAHYFLSGINNVIFKEISNSN